MANGLRWVAGTLGLLAAGFAAWIVCAPPLEPAGEASRAAGPSRPPLAPPEAAAGIDIVITPGQRGSGRHVVQTAAETPADPGSANRQPVPGGKPTGKPLAAADGRDETWQVIQLDGQRIGWSRTTTLPMTDGGRTRLKSTTDVSMKFRRFGQQIEMRKILATEETLEGALLSYSMEMRNPPADVTLANGVVRGNQLRVETTVGGRTQVSQVDWDVDVRSPAWQERLFRAPPLRPGDKKSFKSFFPDFNKVATVKATADQKATTKLFDGREVSLLRVKISNSIAPEMVTRAYLDDEGRILRTDDDMLGRTLTAFTVSEKQALEQTDGAEVDLAEKTLIPCGTIRQAHKRPKTVYRLTLPGDDPAKYLSEGETQAVRRMSAESVELTVTQLRLPRELKPAPIDDEYRRPSSFLQSNDRAVMDHARKAALGVETNPLQAAVQMERYVNRALKKKNFSTALASAAEVAKSLEGDCTEHAVLLAAMLRAGGIPSRVAVGLVYVDSAQAFGGHMWTEAWLGGHWYPLDATLGQGGVGSAHIRLAESSFAEDAPSPVGTFLPLIKLLGRMKIEPVDVQ